MANRSGDPGALDARIQETTGSPAISILTILNSLAIAVLELETQLGARLEGLVLDIGRQEDVGGRLALLAALGRVGRVVEQVALGFLGGADGLDGAIGCGGG